MIELITLGSAGLSVYLTQKFAREWWFHRQKFDMGIISKHSYGEFAAPVDSTVVYIKEVKDGKVTTEKKGRVIDEDWVGEQDGVLIGLYMCIYDRHFIINPLTDTINVRHVKTDANIPMMDLWEYINFYVIGRFVDWFEEKAFDYKLQNEKVIYDYGSGVKLMGIADKFVNKIIIPKELLESQELIGRGIKIGHIKRGSQVDVFIPKRMFNHTDFKVGDKVKAGDILCTLKNEW